MLTYPRKIRVRRRGKAGFIEELAPSRGGSFYLKRRLVSKGSSLSEVVRETPGVSEFLALPGEVPSSL